MSYTGHQQIGTAHHGRIQQNGLTNEGSPVENFDRVTNRPDLVVYNRIIGVGGGENDTHYAKSHYSDSGLSSVN